MTLRLALLALLAATPAFADDSDDAVIALLNNCVTPLELALPLGDGLERAAPAMETKLLDGKAARIFRTGNPKIVIVAHDSGETCEIMALGMSISGFDDSLRAWLAGQRDYKMDAEAKMTDDMPGGAYLARAIEEGFVQAFIQTQPEQSFVGITVSRVAESVHAAELLAP